jgi:hypothetical protein
MPLQNRVTPLGEIITDPARGHVYGNRGCLHDAEGRIRRRYSGKLWIACRLEFKDRRRPLLRPGRYTELFFLDDATALAAGHRPCAECRREDYNRFLAQWPYPGERAPEINARLHAERLDEHRGQRHHDADLDALPDGTFIVRDGAPWLVHGDRLRRWTPAGYTDALPRPTATAARVITPPSLVATLAAGWKPTSVPLIA